MRVDRLEKLSKYLREDVPRSHFDTAVWARRGFEDRECGTSACALGWATICFPGEGLRLEYDDSSDCGGVVYEGEMGFDAAARFLDIPFEHAVVLFGVPGAIDEVAQRLVDYVRDPEAVYRRYAWSPEALPP